MMPPWAAVKLTLRNVASPAVEAFTGDNRTLLLLLLCSSCSLLFSSLLLLYLLFSLGYRGAVAAGVAGGFGASLAAALFASKRARCLATLFVMSVFVKKSRNLLLTAGTSLVILNNVRNALGNLGVLSGSVVCSLKAKRAAIAAPFRNYVRMLKLIGNMLKADLGVGTLTSDLRVSPRLGSRALRDKLTEAELKLNETLAYVQTLTTSVSTVTSRVFPAVSLLVLTAFVALHVKRYRSDAAYKNRSVCSKFARFDEKQELEGKASVLPLSPEEQKRFAGRRSATDRRAVLRFLRPAAFYLADWVVIIAVDALLFHLVRVITTELSELEPLHVPLLISITDVSTLAGIPLVGGNREEDFSYTVSLFEKECLPRPKLLLHGSVSLLALILLALLVMAFFAGKMSQVRLRVCGQFFPSAAERRVEYLHAHILESRTSRRKEEQRCSTRSLMMKPEFWCPLLFQTKEDPRSEV